MGGGVSSAIARSLGAVISARAAMLASHAMLIGLTFGLAFTLVMLLFGPALLQLLGGPRQRTRAGDRLYPDIFRRRGDRMADEYAGRNLARHRQHEAAVADRAWVLRSARFILEAARSALASARCRNSACAASPPAR